MLAADFYPKVAGYPATVEINSIIAGRRTKVIGFQVKTKREARHIAAAYGAKPWNF